jgi:hypothetical protein
MAKADSGLFVSWLVPSRKLVEHFGAKVSKRRPGNQDSGDKSKHTKNAHDGDSVTGFDIIDDIGCGFHGVSPMFALNR